MQELLVIVTFCTGLIADSNSEKWIVKEKQKCINTISACAESKNNSRYVGVLYCLMSYNKDKN